MKALIVDDEPLARNELHYLLNELSQIELIEEAETVEETLEKLLYDTYDLVFLDINLMDENGIDLAHKIQKMKQPPYIIFATAHDTFAVKAFELNAIDYILKPFELERVAQAVQKVEKAIHLNTGSSEEDTQEDVATASISESNMTSKSVIPIEVDERIYVLHIEEIVAISVNTGVTTIITLKRTYQTTEPLTHFEKKIAAHKFIKIHRATIINKKYIDSVEHWFNYTYQVTMTTGDKFQVSRSFMKNFKHEIGLI
ncbi:response regulator transcription factor LytR [Staphylococcus sp. NRL 16/872]|uniref:response regulator transcription factor LytR n=1 Tax=Staphylococcus sp. NRL 16/872 TaxID=2930131 RepID=UPI001FB1E3DE|nr:MULTISPECIES: response regulator transcription factor LytR [unclassified Staphylococcus]MCJ1655631.1 response regulator transcription factor LytR [Staphylococcus sp. NRL 21/187]MCJ1661454.1 response regulator transcription factor LytR [Staphylococcus sp. NRL 18/288]MCJ1667357.1 response regulator transcription factor LytR [Staphylococcus sp. NRL 19/737]WEN69837.1 response regulator transcription factor LytR [Staphylococcus sp. NRL 16/872]